MKEILLIDELRDIRRQLAEEQMLDVERYAAMLRKVADVSPGKYVDKPLVPQAVCPVNVQSKSAG
ncbi:MAG TPA: hypothetical protein VNX28_00515 [Gemmataceae bacterium]|nr:hypothetical protein [Gemmataceae bacterium]